MNDKQASTTALMVAGFRAMATASDDPTLSIIEDPWAGAIVGEDLERVTSGFLASFPAMTLWIAVRTAYLDGWVRRFTSAPFAYEQVVILGAGFDTRAARLQTPGVRFFEVDTPASQAAKQQRLAQLKDYPVDAATYVACDFEQQEFLEQLKASGFSTEKPAFFVWEGVSYYLSEAAVSETLRAIGASHPDAVVAFDFVGKKFVQREIPDDQQGPLDVVSDMGEPMRWGCNDILPILISGGFRAMQTTRFDEACLAFTQTYDRQRMFRFQSLAVASPNPALAPVFMGLSKD